MSLTQLQIEEAFSALGLSSPSAAEVYAIEATPNTVEGSAEGLNIILGLPQVQTQVVPVVEMFTLALGHIPTSATLSSMVHANLSEPSLASAFISSQAFANVYDGGAPLNPNAPVSADMIDALFINNLGHPPSVATLAGFESLTNEQALVAFATSETVTQALACDVHEGLTQLLKLEVGFPAGQVAETEIVGQAGVVHFG